MVETAYWAPQRCPSTFSSASGFAPDLQADNDKSGRTSWPVRWRSMTRARSVDERRGGPKGLRKLALCTRAFAETGAEFRFAHGHRRPTFRERSAEAPSKFFCLASRRTDHAGRRELRHLRLDGLAELDLQIGRAACAHERPGGPPDDSLNHLTSVALTSTPRAFFLDF